MATCQSHAINLWSAAPSAPLTAASDVVTTTPNLVNTSYVRTVGGSYDATTIELTSGSAAIGKGKTISVVTTDYFGTPRTGAYDIAADQH